MKTPLFAALLLICFTSCKKGESTNTSNEVADSYVGNYKVTDTFSFFNGATGFVDVSNTVVNGTVSKTSATTVLFNGMFVCNKVPATVTATSIRLLADSSCTGSNAPLGFTGNKAGTTIYYRYSSETAPGETLATHSGKAEKLP